MEVRPFGIHICCNQLYCNCTVLISTDYQELIFLLFISVICAFLDFLNPPINFITRHWLAVTSLLNSPYKDSNNRSPASLIYSLEEQLLLLLFLIITSNNFFFPLPNIELSVSQPVKAWSNSNNVFYMLIFLAASSCFGEARGFHIIIFK